MFAYTNINQETNRKQLWYSWLYKSIYQKWKFVWFSSFHGSVYDSGLLKKFTEQNLTVNIVCLIKKFSKGNEIFITYSIDYSIMYTCKWISTIFNWLTHVNFYFFDNGDKSYFNPFKQYLLLMTICYLNT